MLMLHLMSYNINISLDTNADCGISLSYMQTQIKVTEIQSSKEKLLQHTSGWLNLQMYTTCRCILLEWRANTRNSMIENFKRNSSDIGEKQYHKGRETRRRVVDDRWNFLIDERKRTKNVKELHNV